MGERAWCVNCRANGQLAMHIAAFLWRWGGGGSNRQSCGATALLGSVIGCCAEDGGIHWFAMLRLHSLTAWPAFNVPRQLFPGSVMWPDTGVMVMLVRLGVSKALKNYPFTTSLLPCPGLTLGTSRIDNLRPLPGTYARTLTAVPLRLASTHALHSTAARDAGGGPPPGAHLHFSVPALQPVIQSRVDHHFHVGPVGVSDEPHGLHLQHTNRRRRGIGALPQYPTDRKGADSRGNNASQTRHCLHERGLLQKGGLGGVQCHVLLCDRLLLFGVGVAVVCVLRGRGESFCG